MENKYLLRKNETGEELWLSKNTIKIEEEPSGIKSIFIDDNIFIFNNNKLERINIKDIEYNFIYNKKGELRLYLGIQDISGYCINNLLRKEVFNDIEYITISIPHHYGEIFLLDKYGILVDSKTIDCFTRNMLHEFLYDKELIRQNSHPATYITLNQLLYKKEIIDGGYRETYSEQYYGGVVSSFMFDFDHTGKVTKLNYNNRYFAMNNCELPITYDEKGIISIKDYSYMDVKVKQLKNGNITIYLYNKKYLTLNKFGHIILKPYQDIEYQEI